MFPPKQSNLRNKILTSHFQRFSSLVYINAQSSSKIILGTTTSTLSGRRDYLHGTYKDINHMLILSFTEIFASEALNGMHKITIFDRVSAL